MFALTPLFASRRHGIPRELCDKSFKQTAESRLHSQAHNQLSDELECDVTPRHCYHHRLQCLHGAF